MSERTSQLSALGVSVWLDDLSRASIVSGHLDELIATQDVVGITTNPTIFANALGATDAYDVELQELRAAGLSAADAAIRLTTGDVSVAADKLLPVHRATSGRDGWVSIEVGATAANDAAATLAEARLLASVVARPNVFVKIPATTEGLEAIADAIAEGISINVTLIFSLDRYVEVIDAYLSGLERAAAAGLELGRIRSVASFFVSRVDTAVNAALDGVGTAEALALRSRAGVANATLAYEIFERAVASGRFRALAAKGANIQRPLWASTGVKDPGLRDTFYVEELVASNAVNTMPEKTLAAVADHAEFGGAAIGTRREEARSTMSALAAAGIDLSAITQALERDGVAAFAASGSELLATIEAAWS